MPFSDFSDLLTDTVNYRHVLTRDEFGKPATYGKSITYAARVVNSIRRVTSRVTGEDAISSTQVWMEPIEPSLDDEFTLPDGSKPSLITWSAFPDENGPHHVKLWF